MVQPCYNLNVNCQDFLSAYVGMYAHWWVLGDGKNSEEYVVWKQVHKVVL